MEVSVSKLKFDLFIRKIKSREHQDAMQKNTFKQLVDDGTLIPIGKFLRNAVTKPDGVRTLPKKSSK